MSQLFTPFQLGGLTLPNRIVVAPMCQYSAVDGCATDWHAVHLGTLAQSGAGLLTLEATAVTPEGRITPGCLGLWDETTAAALGRALAVARKHSDMPVAIQLSHAGRKASSAVPWQGGQLLPAAQGGWATLAPSALPQLPQEAAPTALDDAGIQRLIEAFAAAARRAHALGIDAIELHAAHGYLLHQCLSPLANVRQDGWGGDLAGRMRLPLAVFDALRAAVPASMPVGVRVSATDWVPSGGWDLPQTLQFAQALAARGCSFMHVSSGGTTPAQQIPVGPGYQVPLAQAVRQACGLPTTAVGLITEPEQAEAIVASGQADLVALARGLLFNPRWPWLAALRLGATVTAAPPYWRSQPAGHSGLFGPGRIGMR